MSRLRFGLLTKFGIFTVLPVIASLGIIYLIMFNVNTVVKVWVLREGRSIAEFVSLISIHATSLNKKDTIAEVIRIIQDNEDVAYLFMQDPSGRVLGSFIRDPDLLNRDDLIEMDSEQLKRFDPHLFHSFLAGNIILKQSKAVYEIACYPGSPSSKEVGLVRIGILKSGVEQINKKVKLAFVISSAGAMIFFSLMIAFIVRTLILPLRQLSSSAEAIARWELDKYVEGINTEDEIGKLADSFNRMLSSIKESEEVLTHRLKTEQMVTEISSDLINADPNDIEPLLKKILGTIGSFMKAECAWACFLSLAGEPEWKHIWYSDNIISRSSEIEPIINDMLLRIHVDKGHIEPICVSEIYSSSEIVTKIGGLPIFGVVKSLLSIPMFRNEALSGFIGLCSVEGETIWHQEDVDVMKTIGSILDSAYRLQQTKLALEKRLEIEKRLKAELEEKTKELSIRNEELDAFVYNVSHDLKAPIISVQGFSSLLYKEYADKIDDIGRLYIDRIQKNSDRMVLLIDDLLELSRIGRVEGQLQATDIAEVISDVIDELSEQIKSRGTQVTINGKMPVITINRTRIRQVFSNLISNANKFMGPDNKEPYIEIGYEDKGEYHQFYIKDNGIGIERQHHEKIFHVFYRLKEIEVEGTGVGLTIVKKIVENFGGKVWVDSEKGRGTTMYFTIPKDNMRRDNF